MTTLPTIDLRELSPGAHDRDAALERLRATVGGIGAFYLTGHGVDAEDADRILGLARRFFGVAPSRTPRDRNGRSPHFRGYTALGNEYTQGQPDWREEVEIRSRAAGAP